MNIKSREQQVRRMADRQGYRIAKCRRRDPNAIGYQMYHLVDIETNVIFASDYLDGYWDLADLEHMLVRADQSRLNKIPTIARKRFDYFTSLGVSN